MDRFSGAMSSITRESSPLESASKLRTLLADLGIKHWSDGLKAKALQPFVYLRRVNVLNIYIVISVNLLDVDKSAQIKVLEYFFQCDDTLSTSCSSALTRKSLETQSSELLPDVDIRFPRHNDERVKRWIEGTRKKIKITLKDQQIGDVKHVQEISKQEALQSGDYVPVISKPEQVKCKEDSSSMKTDVIHVDKGSYKENNSIKTEPPSQESEVSCHSVNVESKPKQEIRTISPITVVGSKPAKIASTKTSHCYPQTTRSFIPISIMSNSQHSQQVVVTVQGTFTSQVERMSSSVSSSGHLPAHVNTEFVPFHHTSTDQPLAENSSNATGHSNLNIPVTQTSSKAESSSSTIHTLGVLQQRQPVPKTLLSTQQALPIQTITNPLLPIPAVYPSSVSVRTTGVNSQSNVRQIPCIGSSNTFTPHLRVSALKVRPNLVQVKTPYGTSSSFPPPYRYTTVSPIPLPSQRTLTPVTQSLYYGQNCPTQSQIQGQLQPDLHPKQHQLHGSGFQSRQEMSLPADNQRVNTATVVPGISAPPPQPVLSQQIQRLPPYSSVGFDKPTSTASSTLNESNYEATGVKRKSADVMDWFADKFIPKKHVKDSVLSSFSDSFAETDSRSSQRSRSPSSDSYTESSFSSSQQKKNSMSFLVNGCQPHEAGTNETGTKINTQYERISNNEKISSEGRTVKQQEERNLPNIGEKPSIMPEHNQSKSSHSFKEDVTCRVSDLECSMTFGRQCDIKPKPGFKNTFMSVKSKEDSPETDSRAVAATKFDVSSNVLDTPASPEQDTPASPDHVAEIPSIEIIDVSESPERQTDDSDAFDTSIDGLARKRDLIRKELDDLGSNSGSPQVNRKIQIKSNDLIEISDEEIEEGELTDDGIENKQQSGSMSIDRRVIALSENDDTENKILRKYPAGVSVTVRREKDCLATKGESAVIQDVNLEKNTVDRKGGENETASRRNSDKDPEKYRFKERDGYSSKPHGYISSRFRTRSRSRSSSSETQIRSNRHKTSKRYVSNDRGSNWARQYKSRGRSSSSEGRYKPQGRSKSGDKRYRSRDRSSSRERRQNSRGRSSSRDRYNRSRRRSSSRDSRYKTSGRSYSKDQRYTNRGRSSSRDRHYRSRGRSCSSERRQRSRERSRSTDKQHEFVYRSSSINKHKDISQKTNRFVFTDHNREANDDNTEEKEVDFTQDPVNENEWEDFRTPHQRKVSTSTAANAWSEILQQKPTNVEVIGGEKAAKEIKTSDPENLDVYQELKDYIAHRKKDEKLTNVPEGNRVNSSAEQQSREIKGYVQMIQNTTSVETLKSWAIKEFKFHSEAEFENIVPKITVDLDLKISQLSKNQRKSLKAKLRKEVEIAIENTRIEQMNTGQTFPVSATENIVKDDKNALEIRPFAPLNLTKDVIERELETVRDYFQKCWLSSQKPVDTQSGCSESSTLSKSYLFSIRQDMQQIETDLMQRITTFGVHYGVPNRRVPNDLLTEQEKNSHFSEENLVLVLTGYIPPRAFQKLTSLREKLESSNRHIAYANDSDDKESFQRLKREKEEIHKARKAVMLSFTGPLSKKRIQKIKTKAKCYRNCIEYFKKTLGEFEAERRLRFLMTSLQDLDKHYSLLTQLLVSNRFYERAQRSVILFLQAITSDFFHMLNII